MSDATRRLRVERVCAPAEGVTRAAAACHQCGCTLDQPLAAPCAKGHKAWACFFCTHHVHEDESYRVIAPRESCAAECIGCKVAPTELNARLKAFCEWFEEGYVDRVEGGGEIDAFIAEAESSHALALKLTSPTSLRLFTSESIGLRSAALAVAYATACGWLSRPLQFAPEPEPATPEPVAAHPVSAQKRLRALR